MIIGELVRGISSLPFLSGSPLCPFFVHARVGGLKVSREFVVEDFMRSFLDVRPCSTERRGSVS